MTKEEREALMKMASATVSAAEKLERLVEVNEEVLEVLKEMQAEVKDIGERMDGK